MSDRLLSFQCHKCNNSVLEFDPPKGECCVCGALDSYQVYFGNISTRLATRGIFIEHVFDDVHTLQDREDKYWREKDQDKENETLSTIRSGKYRADTAGSTPSYAEEVEHVEGIVD